MESYQTLEKLEEKVYVLNDSSEIESVLSSFMNELYSRRRNDSSEGGLQACGVIGKNKSGFKVNERNGLAGHNHTFETLAQYLAGDTRFSTEESIGHYSREKMNIPTSNQALPYNSITLRILARQNNFELYFITRLNGLSDMQIEIVNSIAYQIKLMVKSNKISNYNIGFLYAGGSYKIQDEEDIDKAFSDFNNFVLKSKDNSFTR